MMSTRAATLALGLVATAASAQVGFGPAAAAQLDPNRLEPGILPAVTFDSDSGLSLGLLGNLVKLAPDTMPYVWRLEAYGSVSLRPAPDGKIETPFHQDYVNLDVPNLWGTKLRANVDARFERSTNTPYFSPGDAAVFDLTRAAHAYDRSSTSLRASLRTRLLTVPGGTLDVFGGLTAQMNWMTVYPDGLLADELRVRTGDQRPFGASNHGLVTAMAGVLWDGRDHETSPTRGTMTELSVRGGAGLGEAFGFAALSADQRFFATIPGPEVVVAVRLAADLLFGNPPFYELGRSGGLNPYLGGGGARSIRGIEGGRYTGKVKLLANFELRKELLDVVVVKQRLRPGVVVFADVGRAFADYVHDPARDGAELGLKVGIGAGLRVRWGEHFVIRADFAFSPGERTSKVAVGVRHNF